MNYLKMRNWIEILKLLWTFLIIYLSYTDVWKRYNVKKESREVNPKKVSFYPPPPTKKHTFQPKIQVTHQIPFKKLCITIAPLHTKKFKSISLFISKKMHFWVKSLKIELFQFEKSDQNSKSVMHIYICISICPQSMSLIHPIV